MTTLNGLNQEAFAKALAAGIAAYEAAVGGNGDGWIEWMGGDCPVGEHTEVDVRFGDGSQEDGERADYWHWNAVYAPIVAYRVSK